MIYYLTGNKIKRDKNPVLRACVVHLNMELYTTEAGSASTEFEVPQYTSSLGHGREGGPYKKPQTPKAAGRSPPPYFFLWKMK